MKKKNLAIIGATGLVGQTILKVLQEQGIINEFNLFLIVSDSSAGRVLAFNDIHYYLYPLSDSLFQFNFEYVIFSAGDEVSKNWAPIFAKHGAIIIDNSAAFRKCEDVPLVVPEINFETIGLNNKIIANPNCSTIQLVVVLKRLLRLSKLKNVILSSYQSVSGAGKDALLDLKNGTRNFFVHGITNNVVAQIGQIDEFGSCAEENKIVFETKKILNQNFDVYATTVRVPIEYCHGESVYVEFEKDMNLSEIKNVLKCDYLEVSDGLVYPTMLTESDKTFVFRIRKVGKNKAMFFILANNLRRGAAFNAVMILKKLILNGK